MKIFKSAMIATILSTLPLASHADVFSQIEEAVAREQAISDKLTSVISFQLDPRNFKLQVEIKPFVDAVENQCAAPLVFFENSSQSKTAKVTTYLSPVFDSAYEKQFSNWLQEFAKRSIGPETKTFVRVGYATVPSSAASLVKNTKDFSLIRLIQEALLVLVVLQLAFIALVKALAFTKKAIVELINERRKKLAVENIQLKQELVGINHLWENTIHKLESTQRELVRTKRENQRLALNAENQNIRETELQERFLDLKRELGLTKKEMNQLRQASIEQRLQKARHEAQVPETQVPEAQVTDDQYAIGSEYFSSLSIK